MQVPRSFWPLALITGGAPVLVSAFTLVAMNIRHVLYGPALIKRVGPDARTRARLGLGVWADG